MRILLDQAAHDMRNKGNNALLQAAAKELHRLWPDAELDTVTLAPTLAKMYYPELRTVRPDDLQPLQGGADRYLALTPHAMWWLPFELREHLWHRWPALMPDQVRRLLRTLLRGRREDRGGELAPPGHAKAVAKQGLEAAIARYDLVVAVGGGYLCDMDHSMVLQVFAHLEAAIARSIPTVMVSQGVGPLDSPDLRARARAILPLVDLIFVRERRVAPALLAGLGVPADRVVMTGDDAIEMAFTARPASRGNGIGVSLRVAPYTAIDESDMAIIGAAVRSAARKFRSPLVALPISSAPHESDITYIRRVMVDRAPASAAWRMLGMPADTIRQMARCRIVVTGTFHGAVFALAQGIPVVALAKSAEYLIKLTGLADEFGSGCRVVRLDGADVPGQLVAAIDDAWASAETASADLLENAARQVKMQSAAYQRIKTLVAEPQLAVAPQVAVRSEPGGSMRLQHR